MLAMLDAKQFKKQTQFNIGLNGSQRSQSCNITELLSVPAAGLLEFFV